MKIIKILSQCSVSAEKMLLEGDIFHTSKGCMNILSWRYCPDQYWASHLNINFRFLLTNLSGNFICFCEWTDPYQILIHFSKSSRPWLHMTMALVSNSYYKLIINWWHPERGPQTHCQPGGAGFSQCAQHGDDLCKLYHRWDGAVMPF